MNMEQVERQYEAIKENAIKWAKGEECTPLEQLDIVVIGEYLHINIPSCFNQFIRSDNQLHVSATGAHKTIFKTLDKIQNGILKKLC
jgi:hypothetical protein